MSQKWLTRDEQLRRPEWLRKRAYIIEKYGSQCQHCRKVTSFLQVHHRYYVGWRMLWQYPDWCLIPVCDEPCHRLVHERDVAAFQDWETESGASEPIAAPAEPEPIEKPIDPKSVIVTPEEASARFAALFEKLANL